jgi:hypothetical protein
VGPQKQTAATTERVSPERKEQKEHEAFLAGWDAFLNHYGGLLVVNGQPDFRAGSEEAWEKFREQRAKAKAPVSEEFEAACSLWRMEFGFHTFQAVRAGIEKLLERKLNSDEPEYYPMCVGIICLYARPFTNNQPVGPLTKGIIPEEYLNLHRDIITLRNQLFAHADASVMTRPDDYPNELVLINDGKTFHFTITPFLAEPPFFKLISPLVDELIKETHYHRDRLVKEFYRDFGLPKDIGEFRLNVVDPAAPIFSKLTEAEKITREATMRPRPK